MPGHNAIYLKENFSNVVGWWPFSVCGGVTSGSIVMRVSTMDSVARIIMSS